jgi:hypothetical protein
LLSGGEFVVQEFQLFIVDVAKEFQGDVHIRVLDVADVARLDGLAFPLETDGAREDILRELDGNERSHSGL